MSDNEIIPKRIVTLHEREEIVGVVNGITAGKTFTSIEIGDYVISLDNGKANTKAIAAQLNQMQKGCRIGVLRFNGEFLVRTVKRGEMEKC